MVAKPEADHGISLDMRFTFWLADTSTHIAKNTVLLRSIHTPHAHKSGITAESPLDTAFCQATKGSDRAGPSQLDICQTPAAAVGLVDLTFVAEQMEGIYAARVLCYIHWVLNMNINLLVLRV